MDLIDLLGDPAYRHMLLNHFPIVGLSVAWLVLVIGLCLRQSALMFTGLALVALTAGASFPVAHYGDAAYPAIYDQLDGRGRDWLDYHAELAESWLPLLYANAALAALGLAAGALRRPLLFGAAIIVALLTLGGIGGAVIVGKAGGRIQHPEFRLSDPPASEARY